MLQKGKEKAMEIMMGRSQHEATKTVGGKKLPAKRPAASQTPNAEPTTKRARTNQTTRATVVRCPEDGCVDVPQAPLSECLGSMFEQLSNIRNGKERGTPRVLSLLVCQAIKEEL